MPFTITITIAITITITITITLKSDFLFRNVIFLLYKFLGGESEIEWYTGSGVWQI